MKKKTLTHAEAKAMVEAVLFHANELTELDRIFSSGGDIGSDDELLTMIGSLTAASRTCADKATRMVTHLKNQQLHRQVEELKSKAKGG